MKSITESGKITCRMDGVRIYGSNLRERVASFSEIVMRVNGKTGNVVVLVFSIMPTVLSILENGITI